MISSDSIKDKPFVKVVLDLILFGLSLGTGLALVFAGHATFAAVFDDLKDVAGKWIVFLFMLISAIGIAYLAVAIDTCGIDVLGDGDSDEEQQE